MIYHLTNLRGFLFWFSGYADFLVFLFILNWFINIFRKDNK